MKTNAVIQPQNTQSTKRKYTMSAAALAQRQKTRKNYLKKTVTKTNECAVKAAPQQSIKGNTLQQQNVVDNASYHIMVDFSKYPQLHSKLKDLAQAEFRDPAQQLLSMLHHTLAEGEARV